MRLARGAGLSWLVILSLTAGLAGQDAATAAQQRLDYLVGTWDSTTEFLDADGNVARVDHSVDIVEPLIGTRVLMTTIVPRDGEVRKTIRFYDVAEERFYEIGLGGEGDVWILSGDLDAYVMTSQSRRTPRGGEIMVRFTHINIQPDSFEARMEVSRDGGSTWSQAPSRQRLVRRTPSR